MLLASKKFQKGSSNLVRIHKLLYFSYLLLATSNFNIILLTKIGCKINLFRLVLELE